MSETNSVEYNSHITTGITNVLGVIMMEEAITYI